MPTHAVLITYRDMLPKVLSKFTTRTQNKYQNGYHIVYFDSGTLKGQLVRIVSGINKASRLKIFISGHGGVGIDYITNDAQDKKQTIEDISGILSLALINRAKTSASCASTEINMISCLFGRTPDGTSGSSPAAKLHGELRARGVYVDLVARTECITATEGGRQTISALNHKIFEPIYGKLSRFYISKAAHSKIRWTYCDGQRVMRIATYDNHGTQVDGDSLLGRRLLWADFVVNELIELIHLKKGGKGVTDKREIVLKDLIVWYDTVQNPVQLKGKISAIVDGTGDTYSDNFIKHRNFISAWFSSELPQKAQALILLLNKYPTS